jgi:hypothetical protein
MLGKILLYPLRFIFFDGTGVGLLLGYSDLDKNIENRFALDLELSGQIVDSNLMHSALFPPLFPVCLRAHSILTVWVVIALSIWHLALSQTLTANC